MLHKFLHWICKAIVQNPRWTHLAVSLCISWFHVPMFWQHYHILLHVFFLALIFTLSAYSTEPTFFSPSSPVPASRQHTDFFITPPPTVYALPSVRGEHGQQDMSWQDFMKCSHKCHSTSNGPPLWAGLGHQCAACGLGFLLCKHRSSNWMVLQDKQNRVRTAETFGVFLQVALACCYREALLIHEAGDAISSDPYEIQEVLGGQSPQPWVFISNANTAAGFWVTLKRCGHQIWISRQDSDQYWLWEMNKNTAFNICRTIEGESTHWLLIVNWGFPFGRRLSHEA